MTVQLDRKDLTALVKGTQPNYDLFSHPLVKGSGDYCGGFVDKWSWTNLSHLTDDQLWELYNLCKSSW
jgi:hypothetical protein